MNIIIVAKPYTAPRTIRIASRRGYALAITALAVAVFGCVGLGAVFGTTLVGPALARAELESARQALEAQRVELDAARESVQRDMDALALRLGRLQAEAMRLNALGDRLAKAGKLDDGEFDFGEVPALGGPASSAVRASLAQVDVGSALSRLEASFAAQSRQLGVLESVLLDREVDASLLPAGIPVRSGYVSSGFGHRADPITGRPDFHPGVDFNGPRGSDVLAVAAGAVSFAGRKPGYGNVVDIDHGNGYMTRYAHNDVNLVQVGDPVRAGEVIARMGATGRATGVHVHFEVWLNGRLVNPSEYIRAIR